MRRPLLGGRAVCTDQVQNIRDRDVGGEGGRREGEVGRGQDMMSVTIITVSSSLNIDTLFLQLNN